MNNKSLAIIGMAGAPFLCLGMGMEAIFPQLSNTWFTGMWGVIYLGGWTCIMSALYRMGVFNLYPFPRLVCYLLFATLTVANISNIMMMITGNQNSPLYFYLDLCWPLSNLVMFVLGLSLIRKKAIPQNLRRIILLTGCWFPLVFTSMMLFGRTGVVFMTGAVYSLISWTLLALLTYRLAKKENTAFVLSI